MLIFEYCVHYVNEHSLDTIGTKFDKSLCLASSESIYGYVELISFLEVWVVSAVVLLGLALEIPPLLRCRHFLLAQR